MKYTVIVQYRTGVRQEKPVESILVSRTHTKIAPGNLLKFLPGIS